MSKGKKMERLLHVAETLRRLVVTAGSLVVVADATRRWVSRQRLTDDGTRETERSVPTREIAQEIANDLGTIRGCCEIAKLKGESGEALARRMDAAIETTGQLSHRIKQLLASREQEGSERSDGKS